MTVPDAATGPCPPQLQPWGTRRGPLGPWLATLWLFFLAPTFIDGFQHRDQLTGVIGMVATLAFAALYASHWIRGRRNRAELIIQPVLRRGLLFVGLLAALGVVIVLCNGESGTAAAVFIAVTAVMLLPLRVAIPAVVVLAAAVLIAGEMRGWPSQGGTVVGIVAGSLAVLGMRGVISRNIELYRAHEENTRLAVDNERNRFARDLHDILGHSLTVITVKAELAQRLIDVDPSRTRDELADLERLSRDALADIRRAVEGYRELTLPGELARARAALTTAEIAPRVPLTTDEVPTELRELFAWSVREGVTNVIRHSGARRCEILISETSVMIRDDGTGSPVVAPEGSGLTGLRERAAAVGAVVTTRTLSPGFSLEVARP